MGMTTDGLSYWQAETEETDLLDLTMGDLLDQRAKAFPSYEAIVYSCYPEFGDALNIRWTYQNYRDRANAIAKGLLALGLHIGDRIAILAPNVPDWPLLMLAAAKAGLVLVTINPVLRVAEIEYILKQGDVQALFLMARVRDYDHLATIQSLVSAGAKNGEVSSERFPKLRHVSLMGLPPAGLLEQEGWRPALLNEVIEAGSAVSDEALVERQTSVRPSDPAILMYTSGTTGFPKGALLTHHGLVNNAVLTAERLAPFAQHEGLARSEVHICNTFPFFHAAGIVTGLLLPLYEGGTIHPLLAFDPLKVIQTMSHQGCHVYIGVTSMILALLQHPDLDIYDLSSVKVVLTGGAPVPLVMVEQVKARLGAEMLICFGQTEGSCCLTTILLDDPYELKAATVGRALPYIDIKIIDAVNGEVVPVGKRGELCARGLLVMAGYYKMPEKTAETIDRDGWLHTGDLATMNAQGYLNVVGRLKDMVIRGGEELLAVVRLKAGEQLSEQELRDYCKNQISHQKIPRYFQFVESFPLTASGKVQKFVLREQAIKALGLEDVAKIKTA